MSMIVEVPEPLAGRLAAEAARRGVSIDQLTVEALHEHLNGLMLTRFLGHLITRETV
jgi:hypothetical protein